MDAHEASESDADSFLADIPSVQSLRQHLLTDTLQVTDGDWARRRQKRLDIVIRIKSTSEYKAVALLRSQGTAAPSTPDAYDRQISKRNWEAKALRWQKDLSVFVQNISLDEKPYWFNKAGHTGTFAKEGCSAPDVRENFAKTRERHSIITSVHSRCRTDPHDPPKLATLFKAKPSGSVSPALDESTSR
jgi:hypothetical protein